MTRVHRLAAVLCIVLASLLLAAPATAQEQSGTNEAVAVNTNDGSSIFRLAFSVMQVTDEVVDPTNTAFAFASCSDCQTVAIAIQVVFVVGSPETFTPENYAIAINQLCSACDTLATAYQFVVQAPTRVKLTAEGQRGIAEIRTDLLALQDSGLSGPEIQAEVDALMEDLAALLATEVEAVPGLEVATSTTTATSPSSSTSTFEATSTTTTTTPEPSSSTTDETSSSTSAP